MPHYAAQFSLLPTAFSQFDGHTAGNTTVLRYNSFLFSWAFPTLEGVGRAVRYIHAKAWDAAAIPNAARPATISSLSLASNQLCKPIHIHRP